MYIDWVLLLSLVPVRVKLGVEMVTLNEVFNFFSMESILLQSFSSINKAENEWMCESVFVSPIDDLMLSIVPQKWCFGSLWCWVACNSFFRISLLLFNL